ncbi:hypothetical protein GCM10010284_65950 [Streptomyces rubiginosohelvolus]|nr:hypothetical protein GCM10010284_65950 [Streptomyces rubiginosohelvolus]
MPQPPAMENIPAPPHGHRPDDSPRRIDQPVRTGGLLHTIHRGQNAPRTRRGRQDRTNNIKHPTSGPRGIHAPRVTHQHIRETALWPLYLDCGTPP